MRRWSHEEHNEVRPGSRRGFSADGVRAAQRAPVAMGIRYTERLAEAAIATSVGSKGGCYDNVLAETINGLHKEELIHRRGPWKNAEAVELATLSWVAWFKHHRLLAPIGYLPPAGAEANYYRSQTGQAALA